MIMRKTDLRLPLTPIILLDLGVMTRTDTGLANIADMSMGLKLRGYRYNEIVFVFFVIWVGLQPLTVVIMYKVDTSLFLPKITFCWGHRSHRSEIRQALGRLHSLASAASKVAFSPTPSIFQAPGIRDTSCTNESRLFICFDE
jgi:hypothetical protein